jgi:hypothetical protein
VIQNISITNPTESKISLIDALTDFDFDPIESTDRSKPSIFYDPSIDGVMNLDVTILRTNDNSVPSKIDLSIFGCGEPATIGSKPALETTTPSAQTVVTQPSEKSIFMCSVGNMNSRII